MNYYAVQVRTGNEGRFMKLARQNIARSGFPDRICQNLLWPRRTLTEKRLGKIHTALKPLYPGYLFYIGDEIPAELHWIIRKTPGFFRFLKDNKHIEPLTGGDREVLSHFLRFGEITEKSRVHFNDNNKIVVDSGPMKGLEGLIVKVDKRKCRAKIRLSLNENSLLVDLAFDVIKSAEEKNGKQE
jgi:transcriptional antiterminator NusG